MVSHCQHTLAHSNLSKLCDTVQVFLQRKDSIGCIFRLHPHIIKVEAVGVAINYHDQIKFESLAIQGQYLHCSKKPLPPTVNSDWYAGRAFFY